MKYIYLTAEQYDTLEKGGGYTPTANHLDELASGQEGNKPGDVVTCYAPDRLPMVAVLTQDSPVHYVRYSAYAMRNRMAKSVGFSLVEHYVDMAMFSLAVHMQKS